MNHRLLKQGLFVISLLFLLVLSYALVTAQDVDEKEQTIRVDYYGELTTFEELFSEGKVVHCVTDTTPSLEVRGIFDPSVDRVLCFDTMEESDAVFVQQHPEFAPTFRQDAINAQNGRITAFACTSWFAFYSSAFYISHMGNICLTSSNHTWSQNSIWENGEASMTVYQHPGTPPSGSPSWTISESHAILGNGWGGTAIRSILWLFP